MYIHEGAKLIYLAHPKTASVATSSALTQYAGFKKVVPGDHHSRIFDPCSPVNVDNRDDWFAFTTVRNHYDTVVSWMSRRNYSMFHTDSPEFTIETLERCLGPENHWVRPHELFWLHRGSVDRILKYENLQEDLNDVLSNHGIAPVELAQDNVSPCRKNRDYRSLYTQETEFYIRGRFHEEMKFLGYTFENGVKRND